MASVEHEGEDLIGYLRTPDLKLDPPANAVEPRGFYLAQKYLRDLLDGLEGGLLGIDVQRVIETIGFEDGGVDAYVETGVQVFTMRVTDPRMRARCIDTVGTNPLIAPDDHTADRPSWLMPEAK